MKLISIINKIIKEQEMIDDENVFELPSKNMTVSIDRNKRKFIFAPFKNKKSSEIRNLINLLKNNFRTTKINNLSDEDSRNKQNYVSDLINAFEVEIDPRENFDSVIDFVKNQ